MCKSIAEGGHRCNGRHLTLDQHANRAERRREADRARKSAKKGAAIHDSLHPSQRAWIEQNHARARAYRPASQLPPEGMWDASDLQDRGIPRYLHSELGEPLGVTSDMYGEYPYWTEKHVREVEMRNDRVVSHLSTSIKTPETKELAKQLRKQQRIDKQVTRTAARTDQRKADDEMAKAEGHPYGKDAEIRRLATPAARDKALPEQRIVGHPGRVPDAPLGRRHSSSLL